MSKIIKITKCRNCNFRSNSMDGMYCGHPYFDGKGYDAMIITQSNVNSFPKECPLRKENLTIIYTIK